MEYPNLSTFHYCATTLSFSKTAEHLGISQPAVTKQIKNLERIIGHLLFVRQGRKLRLTEEGSILFTYSSKIFVLYNEALEQMNLHKNQKLHLKIAGDLNYLTMSLAPFIHTFTKRFPTIEFEIITCENARQIFDGVNERTFDIGIMSANYSAIGVHEKLLSNDNIYLVASTKLARQLQQSPNQNFPLLTYKTASAYSHFLQEFIQKNNLADYEKITFNNLEMIRQALLSHTGIAALSEDVIKDDILNGHVTILATPKEAMKIKTKFIYRTDNPMLQYIQQCWRLMEELVL